MAGVPDAISWLNSVGTKKGWSLLMLAVSDWSPVSGLTLFFLHFRSKKEAIATKPDSAAIVPTVDPIIFDFPSWVSLFEVCFVVFGVYVCLLVLPGVYVWLLVLPRINLTVFWIVALWPVISELFISSVFDPFDLGVMDVLTDFKFSDGSLVEIVDAVSGGSLVGIVDAVSDGSLVGIVDAVSNGSLIGIVDAVWFNSWPSSTHTEIVWAIDDWPEIEW